jgi:hypothetical protein
MDTDGKPFQIKTDRPVKKDAIPREPWERDESPDSQASAVPREDIQQAYEDLENGLVDTDLRGSYSEDKADGPDTTARGNAPRKER